MDLLLLRSIASLVFVHGLVAALLFGAARTVAWLDAWVFLVEFGVINTLVMGWLWRHDRALLRRRLVAGPLAERSHTQRLLQLLVNLGFVALFVVAGFDHRTLWSDVPLTQVLTGDALVAVGLGIVFAVFRENPFTAAIVDVVADQRVVVSGLYAYMRHPMYLGALVMLVGTALALGSYLALLPVAALALVIVLRLFDEERVLTERLDGYADYRRMVRYRLLPLVW